MLSPNENTSSDHVLDVQGTQEAVRMLRAQGQLAEAINVCEQAAKRYPESIVFPIAACDMHLATGRPEPASAWLLEMLLRRWMAGATLFNEFAKRYQRVISRLDPQARVAFLEKMEGMISQGRVNRRLAGRCQSLIDASSGSLGTFVSQTATTDSKQPHKTANSRPVTATKLEDSFELDLTSSIHSNDQNIYLARKTEATDPEKLERIIKSAPIDLLHDEKNKQLFDFLIAFLERRDRFEEALRLLANHPRIQQPSPLQASYLRVCRKLGRFDQIQELLSENPDLARTDVFNVLYELVYFYEAQNDLQRAHSILSRIEKLFTSQQPILQTLRNFYLRLGMFPDASRVDLRLAELRGRGRRGRRGSQSKYKEAVSESQAEVYSDLEHQRQLAALSDVTNGISHELGQPITNIRYTIQLFRRQLERELRADVVFKVFDTVLSETERMGGLVKRLAPITSGRKVIEHFDAVSRVRDLVDVERARLSEHGIKVRIDGVDRIDMKADPVRFDQLISNLLLNAMDAIGELATQKSGHIVIQLSKTRQGLRLVFEDSGPGISPTNRRKIFEPFFSTKPPGKGEGLGLFIVWNLLKMQGGSISVDSTYAEGARFVVYLPTETKISMKQSEP